MPWWAWLYLAVLLLVVAGNLAELRKLEVAGWHLGLRAASGIAAVVGTMAFFQPHTRALLGPALVAGAALVLVADPMLAWRERRLLPRPPELDDAAWRRLRTGAVAAAAALWLPAALFGAAAAWRAVRE